MFRFKSLFVAVVACAVLSGCASTQYIKDEDATRFYQLSYADMMTIVPQSIDISGMKVKDVNADTGEVEAIAPPSFWTSSFANMIAGGDTVNVKVTAIELKNTKVYIKVTANMDAMDMGRSARVVKTIFKNLDDLVDQKIKAMK